MDKPHLIKIPGKLSTENEVIGSGKKIMQMLVMQKVNYELAIAVKRPHVYGMKHLRESIPLTIMLY